MAESINPANLKVAPGFTFGTALAAGVAKVATEQALSRVKWVGNGTFKSGLIKIGGAYLVNRTLANKGGAMGFIGQSVSTGMAIDGVEDMVAAAIKRFGWGMGGSNGTSVGAEPVSASRVI